MATTSPVNGKVHYDPTPAKQFTKGKIDEFWDKREVRTKELLKQSAILFAPTMMGLLAYAISFIPLIPTSVREWINQNGTKVVTENCEPAAAACAKAVHHCSKRMSHQSADRSLDLYAKLRNMTAAWIK